MPSAVDPGRLPAPRVLPHDGLFRRHSSYLQTVGNRHDSTILRHTCIIPELTSTPAIVDSTCKHIDDGSNALAPPPECDASLNELLTPLIAEHVCEGRLRPPEVLELQGAFAAISAVGGMQGCSHYIFAVQTLAQQGFRKCSLVADKLGLSIRCEAQSDQGHGDQVDFPWSTISDVQEPNLKQGLQSCAVTFGIREPRTIGDAPNGGLALVLRLRNHESAKALADAATAFKAYETQMLLWKACNHGKTSDATIVSSLATLLLDEQGYPFWSCEDETSNSGSQCVGVFPEPLPLVFMDQGSSAETPCCNLCWC